MKIVSDSSMDDATHDDSIQYLQDLLDVLNRFKKKAAEDFEFLKDVCTVRREEEGTGSDWARNSALSGRTSCDLEYLNAGVRMVYELKKFHEDVERLFIETPFFDMGSFLERIRGEQPSHPPFPPPSTLLMKRQEEEFQEIRKGIVRFYVLATRLFDVMRGMSPQCIVNRDMASTLTAFRSPSSWESPVDEFGCRIMALIALRTGIKEGREGERDDFYGTLEDLEKWRSEQSLSHATFQRMEYLENFFRDLLRDLPLDCRSMTPSREATCEPEDYARKLCHVACGKMINVYNSLPPYSAPSTSGHEGYDGLLIRCETCVERAPWYCANVKEPCDSCYNRTEKRNTDLARRPFKSTCYTFIPQIPAFTVTALSSTFWSYDSYSIVCEDVPSSCYMHGREEEEEEEGNIGNSRKRGRPSHPWYSSLGPPYFPLDSYAPYPCNSKSDDLTIPSKSLFERRQVRLAPYVLVNSE